MRAKVGARLTVTKSTSTGHIVPIDANCGMTVVEDTTPDDNTDNTYTITDFSTERMYSYIYTKSVAHAGFLWRGRLDQKRGYVDF